MNDCEMLRALGVIPKNVECCSICHTDMEENEGYRCCSIEIECCEYEVCCTVAYWWNSLSEEEREKRGVIMSRWDNYLQEAKIIGANAQAKLEAQARVLADKRQEIENLKRENRVLSKTLADTDAILTGMGQLPKGAVIIHAGVKDTPGMVGSVWSVRIEDALFPSLFLDEAIEKALDYIEQKEQEKNGYVGEDGEYYAYVHVYD